MSFRTTVMSAPVSTRAVTPCLPSFTSTYLAEDVELTEVAAAAVELAVGWPALPELVVLLFAAEAADVAAAVATDAAATGAVTTGEAATGVAADSPQAVAADPAELGQVCGPWPATAPWRASFRFPVFLG